MAIHFQNLNIRHFRGIHHLAVDHLNHINIIAGDNNSGKTSVLEALMLLRSPNDITNILRLALERDFTALARRTSVFESFLNLFSRDTARMEISLEAIYKGEFVSYKLSGEQTKIMMDPDDIVKRLNTITRSRVMREIDPEMVEVDTFRGELEYRFSGQGDRLPVTIDAFETTSGREIKNYSLVNIVYLSPIDHVRGLVFNRIIRNESYKEICLRVLQIFDSEIVDLLILTNEGSNRPVEYIKHTTLGNMPLSTYGDGIKKVLSLANGIVQAADGVLLIDEIETAIHSKYYDDIFRFLVKASKQFRVQVFITTHSIEAIDGLLSTQDYEKQEQIDDISVLTFKKDIKVKKTYSRVLDGRHVHKNREQFGFEVRL